MLPAAAGRQTVGGSLEAGPLPCQACSAPHETAPTHHYNCLGLAAARMARVSPLRHSATKPHTPTQQNIHSRRFRPKIRPRCHPTPDTAPGTPPSSSSLRPAFFPHLDSRFDILIPVSGPPLAYGFCLSTPDGAVDRFALRSCRQLGFTTTPRQRLITRLLARSLAPPQRPYAVTLSRPASPPCAHSRPAQPLLHEFALPRSAGSGLPSCRAQIASRSWLGSARRTGLRSSRAVSPLLASMAKIRAPSM